MSDALNFLVKARPAAMTHYFSFLKDCGKHLDPKTRDLISVITKVHSQTERGFRQYLKRALRAGCSAAEILDAMLTAFPALGLAKIVWAVDIILAMDLPEFPNAALGGEGQWHDLMASADLEPGGTAARRHGANRVRRPRVVRAPRRRGLESVRQPLPAPDHQHPAPGALRRHADLPEARMGLRHSQRAMHGQGRHTTQAMGQQGRRRPPVGPMVMGAFPHHDLFFHR